MFGRSATTWRRHPRGEQDPAHGRPREGDVVVFGQHLSQMLVVEALVAGASQLHDSLGGRAVHHVTGRPTPIAVSQAGHALFAVSPVQPLDLAHRDAKQLGRLAVHQGTRVQVVEDTDTTLLSPVQNDPVPHGATESLYRSPLTDSLYSHTEEPSP